MLTFADVAGLLTRCDLPSDDLGPEDLAHFDTIVEGGRLIGVVSVQVAGDVAWLRSLAIDPEMRGRGLGGVLVRRAESRAKYAGAQSISLLTKTAEPFFTGLGYDKVGRDSAPAAVRAFKQFDASCCTSGAFMTKSLHDTA